MVELRAEIEESIIAVMDGYCSANGSCRTKLTNEILGEWAAKKYREATVILRVAGSNPTLPDIARKDKG